MDKTYRVPYFDERFASVFEIFLDENFRFMVAFRYPERIGHDGIAYRSFDELPVWHRGPIRDRIEQFRRHAKENPQ